MHSTQPVLEIYQVPIGIGILSCVAQAMWHARYWGGTEKRGGFTSFDSVSMPMLYLSVALFVAAAIWAIRFAREFRGSAVATGIKLSVAMGILLMLFSGCSAVIGGS